MRYELKTQHPTPNTQHRKPKTKNQKPVPCFLIGEVGSNHNRDFGLAKRLIEVAAEAGLDAVKFQAFRAAWLYPPTCGEVETPMGKVDFFTVLEENQLPTEWLPELKAYAEQCGLQFLCTPFDEQAVGALRDIGVNGLKIASPELNHLPLLRTAAQTGLPLLCSTGISTLSDIEEALNTIRAANPAASVTLLQCVSGYPTPPEQANLAVIETLHRAFGVPVGFSDHTIDGDFTPLVATAAGACLIEKHFTLNRDLPGPDHPFALEPQELKAMARGIREVESIPSAERIPQMERCFGTERVRAALGHGHKEIMPIEAELYPCDKRSIHAIRDIAPGEPLTPDNIRILRSERNLTPGLHPRHWETLLGTQVTCSVSIGEGVQWNHVLTISEKSVTTPDTRHPTPGVEVSS